MVRAVSIYRSQMRVPEYRAPEIRPVDMSSGLAEVGDELSQFAKREQARDFQDRELGLVTGVSELKARVRDMPWREREKAFDSGLRDLQSRFVSAPGAREVQDQARVTFQRLMLANREALTEGIRRDEGDESIASTLEALERLKGDAAKGNADERALAKESGRKLIGHLRERRFVDDIKAVNLARQFLGDVDEFAAKGAIGKNPWRTGQVLGDQAEAQRAFPDLSPLQLQSLHGEAQREARHREAEARARAAEQRAMSAKVEADRREAEAKLTELVGALNLVGSGAPLDPRSAQDRKAVDLAWGAKAETVGEDMKLPALIGFADQVGMIPDAGKKMIRGLLRSGSDQNVLAAVEAIGRIKTVNPELLNDFAREDLNLATSVLAQADGGVDPALALRRYREGLQVDETTRKVRLQHFSEAVKAAPDDASRTLREATGGEASWLALLGGEWRTDAEVPAEAAEEFNRLRREEFVRTGNMDGATRFAKDSVSRVYGVTTLGGGRAVTKYAPEKLYGSPKLSLKENAEWIKEQALSEAKAVLGDVPEGQVSLTPAKRVGPDGLPGYVITITTEDGRMVTPERNGRPLLFVPDFKSSPAASKKKAEEKRAVDAAREEKEWQRRTVDIQRGAY